MVPKNTPSRSPISQMSVGIEEWSSYPTLGYRPRCAWRQGIQALSPSGSHPARVPLTIIAEFTDPHEHNLHGRHYQDPATATPADNSNFAVCLHHEACTFPGPIAPPCSRIRNLRIFSVLPTHVGMRGNDEEEPTLLSTEFSGRRFQTCNIWISVPPTSETAYM